MSSTPYEYIPEGRIPNVPSSFPVEGLAIISQQAKNNILKIINQRNVTGTGFFCLIPFPDKTNLLPTLITNNHVLNEYDIETKKKIKFSSQEKNYEIEIDNQRRCYTNKEYDTTIIEMKANEANINKFLEIDENIFNNDADKLFGKSSVYIMHYPNGNQNEISFGKNKKIDSNNIDIIHECDTLPGSSGGPIINNTNYKVIGIHKGSEENKKYNLGTLLKLPIKKFIEKFPNRKVDNIPSDNEFSLFNDNSEENIVKDNNHINNQIIKEKEDFVDEITVIYTKENVKSNNFLDNLKFKIASTEIFSQNKLFGEKFVKNNINKCKIIIYGKEYELSSFINEEYNDDIYFLELKLRGVSKIINMDNMFCGCISLSAVPDIDLINTKNVIYMSNIFSGCESLLSLPDISKWDTGKVITIGHLFQYCVLLTSLPDISKWDTSNVRDMTYVFCMCEKLLSLPDISKWNTSKVQSFFSMFHSCESLKVLPDISKWNTSNVKDMGFMFESCKNLISLPDISKWNTCNLTDTRYMFHNCSSLRYLPDIAKWNTNNIKETNNMFFGCKSNLNIPKKFRGCYIF